METSIETSNNISQNDVLKKIVSDFDLKEIDLRTYNPLSFAFIGDCVFEIMVRTVIVCKGNKSTNALSKEKNAIVNAKTQSKMAEILKDYYTEEEAEIYRSGKNAKTANHSKSAAYNEYHKATGLEAVFGFLYLSGRMDRCIELYKLGIDLIDKQQ